MRFTTMPAGQAFGKNGPAISYATPGLLTGVLPTVGQATEIKSGPPATVDNATCRARAARIVATPEEFVRNGARIRMPLRAYGAAITWHEYQNDEHFVGKSLGISCNEFLSLSPQQATAYIQMAFRSFYDPRNPSTGFDAWIVSQRIDEPFFRNWVRLQYDLIHRDCQRQCYESVGTFDRGGDGASIPGSWFEQDNRARPSPQANLTGVAQKNAPYQYVAPNALANVPIAGIKAAGQIPVGDTSNSSTLIGLLMLGGAGYIGYRIGKKSR